MRVIATAGHVDHGKSTLLRALTGMEPDRWEEERRRGLTIDLGFVWTTAPDLAFVDVPGHERFLTNMLAGVGPVPAVMFVVAADAGWQAQSREHLEVLDALGIRHGVLVVTRADLADPSAALGQAAQKLSGTGLAGVPAVAVSATTGAGLPELRDELARMAALLPGSDPDSGVRLWIDRVFTITGRGTVVTGTLGAGTVRVGDRLRMAGSDEELHVRGLHTLEHPVEQVDPPARIAINVRGRAADGLRRGDALLTPGRWLDTEIFDVRSSSADRTPPPRQVTFHTGAAAIPATVRPLGADFCRITLRRPLPLRVGDRTLLRDPGSRRIWDATVMDVRPPRLQRRGAAAHRTAQLGQVTGTPDGAALVRLHGLIRRADLIAMGVKPPAEPVTSDWVADPEHWIALGERLTRTIQDHAVRQPHDPGLSVEAARRQLDLPDRSLVEALVTGTPLRLRRGKLFAQQEVPTLPPDLRHAVDTVRAELADSPFRAPQADRLTVLGLHTRALATAHAAQLLLRITDGIVLLPDAEEQAVRILGKLPQPFTVTQARQALDTTRRVALPLLEYLDRRGRTVRIDDLHRRLREHRPPTGG
ncbi:selenocysteine-specific translation elongation factor [Actinomadura alba]|uniref:Selenocysteine-specific translation elongation factor n=1 Tax=Actinomadura alba TaxID=406431 RepID=A0ABR7LHH6_9ACTN|nr:selenocysteine-specific translation elongation factor [Actinomadura alba]MBC6463962.1 selenocysteine-specific translation elongation factor [Actinomadura alba]